MSKEALRRWLKEPLTVDFFERVRALERSNDEKLRESLSKRDYEEAANWNAGLDQVNEVLDIPNQIKLDIEEKADGREEGNLGS